MALTANTDHVNQFAKYSINIGAIDFSKTMVITELFYDTNKNRLTSSVSITSLKAFIEFLVTRGLLVDPVEDPKGVIKGQSNKQLRYSFDDYFGYTTATDVFNGVGSSLITATGGPGFLTITYDGHTYSIMGDGTAPVLLS